MSGSTKLGLPFLTFGFGLPLFALIYETQTHYCAQHFFDPFPTDAHAAWFAVLPLSNFLIYLSQRKNLSTFFGPLILANGMALGVALMYSLMMLPLVPQSLMGLVFFGFGLLGLAPLLAIGPTWTAGHAICLQAESHGTFFKPRQLERFAHIVAVCTVFAMEATSSFTRIAMHMALEPESKQRGIELLRNFGNRDVMLRACYEHAGKATDIVGSFYEPSHPLSVADARWIFYKVTGRAFNTLPVPDTARATIANANIADVTGFNSGGSDEFDYDPDVAGETVSGIARGLTLEDSRMAINGNGDGMFASIEWQMRFHNRSKFEREVRTSIQLPVDAVVTAASVNIDGKEREATIIERSQARQIYRNSALQRKDPLLVSTSGTDAILVQCYPVRPESDATVKLHMVMPLELLSQTQGIVTLPTFQERNFQLERNFKHSLDVTAHGAKDITSNIHAPVQDLAQGAGKHLHTSVSADELSKNEALITITGGGTGMTAEFAGHKWVGALQLDKPAWSPEKVILVIDGSAAMQPFMPDIAQAISTLPFKNSQVVFVGDTAVRMTGTPPELAKQLTSVRCEGGQDVVSALQDALRESVGSKTVVVCIHGTQPDDLKVGIDFSSPAGTDWESRNDVPAVYDMQLSSGANVVTAKFAGLAIERVERLGTIEEDLRHLCDTWQNGEWTLQATPVDGTNVPCGPSEFAQLCAYGQLLTLVDHGSPSESTTPAAMAALAMDNHIVTPFTSAVVVPDEKLLEEQLAATRKGEEAEQRLAALRQCDAEIKYKSINLKKEPISQLCAMNAYQSCDKETQTRACAEPMIGYAASAKDSGSYSAGRFIPNPFASCMQALAPVMENKQESAQCSAPPSCSLLPEQAKATGSDQAQEYLDAPSIIFVLPCFAVFLWLWTFFLIRWRQKSDLGNVLNRTR